LKYTKLATPGPNWAVADLPTGGVLCTLPSHISMPVARWVSTAKAIMPHKIAVMLADGRKTNADYLIDDKPTPKVRQYICVRCDGRLLVAQVTKVVRRSAVAAAQPSLDLVEAKEI